MNKEGLEDMSRLRSLEAENKHLKNLLNKVVSPLIANESNSNAGFEYDIKKVFEDAFDYKSGINAVLKVLSEKTGADRISVYAYQRNMNGYCVAYQYANGNIQEYHPSDLIIDSAENPLEINNGFFFSANLFEDLKSTLSQKFEIFQVQSILVLPFSSFEIPEGMIILESCTFKREWYPFEIENIVIDIQHFTSVLNTVWYKNDYEQDVHLRKVLEMATKMLSYGGNSQKTINRLIELVGEKLNLVSFYILNNGGISDQPEFLWGRTRGDEENTVSGMDIARLLFKGGSNQSGFFDGLDLVKAGIKNSSPIKLFVSQLHTVKGGVRFMVCEFDSMHSNSEARILSFFESLAQLILHLVNNIYNEIDWSSRYKKVMERNVILESKKVFLDGVLKQTPTGIVVVKDKIINYANSYILNLCGQHEEDIIGKPIYALYGKQVNENDKEQVERFYHDILEGEVALDEMKIINKNGAEKVLSVTGINDMRMQEETFLFFVADVTDKIKVKKELGELRERYHKIIESSIDGVIIIDQHRQVKFVNKSARDLLGYSLKEVLQLSVDDLFDSNSKGIVDTAVIRIDRDGNYRADASLLKKDGCVSESEMCGTNIKLDGIDHYYFTIHDISSRKQNEKILTQREKEFRTLAQNSPDIILRLNSEGQILFFNKALVEQFGFLDAADIEGKSLTDLGVLDELVGLTWQAKINDVFLFGEKLSMELGFSDESKELYYDWIMTPEIDDFKVVDTILAIGRNVMARKNVEKELMEAKVKAEESDKLKSSFLSNMSHELRTPLNAIVGFSALLRGDDISPDEKEEYINVIQKNSDSLMGLVNNIIDVAKIESGKISIEKEKLNLNSLLDSLYNDFLTKVEVEHKGRVKLYLSKPKNVYVDFISDPIRLRQVLVNLIGNAVKFTIKGFIEFGYIVKDDEVRFFVKDTGIGISEAKQKIIFQPFRKEEEASNQIFRGTGIGLSICEKIVTALGGKIGLLSEKGKGAEFYFTHPYEQNIINNRNLQMVDAISFSQPVLPKNYHWPNKLVLLVDENSGAHLQIRKLIEKTGLTLVSARTAAGASKLLLNRKDIHLVLMDLNFPDADGFDLVRIIKHQHKELPVIAHTIKAVNAKRERLLDSGFDACVAKPTEKEELLMVLDQFLVASEK